MGKNYLYPPPNFKSGLIEGQNSTEKGYHIKKSKIENVSFFLFLINFRIQLPNFIFFFCSEKTLKARFLPKMRPTLVFFPLAYFGATGNFEKVPVAGQKC